MNRYLILLIFLFSTLLAEQNNISYENYFKNNKNIMLFIDPTNGAIVKANKSASDFYGYSISQLEKMRIQNFNTFTKEQVQEEMRKAKEQKRNYFLFSHKLADGSVSKVRVFSSPIVMDGKKLLYSTIYPLVLEEEFLDHFNETLEEQVVLQTDLIKQNESKIRQIYLIGFILLGLALFIAIINLIQRNKLAKELEESNKRFSLAMESTKDGLWDWDPISNEVYFNLSLKTMLGYTHDDMENSFEAWHTKLHREDYDRVMNDLNTHLEGKTPFYESVYRLAHKDGSWVWIFARGKAVFDENGKATRAIGFHTDITKQKELSAQMEKQKLEYKTIFDYAQDGIAIVDLDLNFLNCNQAFLDMTGYSMKEILSKNCDDFTLDEAKALNKETINEAIKNGHVENIEKNFIVANGKRLTVSMSISLLPDKKSLLVLLHDTTVLKLMEEQSKLASMGEMIGNIAHQWRQPLSVISTAASGVSFKLEFNDEIDKEEVKEITANIVSQTKYLSKTIDDFKNFVKGDKVDKELSVKDTINEVINLTKATIDNNYIELVTDINDDIQLFGNKNELEQAFINIINNAKDSLKEHVKNDDDKYIFISTKTLDDGSFSLKILDSGGGIPLDIIDRIFEPYFTTKHQSLGTGIGLSMVNKIIRERHQGQIQVFNEEFKYNDKNYTGASFNIIFK